MLLWKSEIQRFRRVEGFFIKRFRRDDLESLNLPASTLAVIHHVNYALQLATYLLNELCTKYNLFGV